jgi:HK97 family phage major capsid protein
MTAGNSIAATAGSTPSVTTIDAECSQLEGAVEDANIPMERCGYIMHPRTKRYLYNLRDGVGGYLYREELRAGKFRSYAIGVTTSVPKNLGSGDDSELYFGDFAQFVMGDTLDMQVDFFPNGTYHDGSAFQSGINNNESVFRALSRHDFQLKHPDAFAMLTGVEWGA